MDCPRCAHAIPDGVTGCPRCGDTLRLKHDPQRDRITQEVPLVPGLRGAPATASRRQGGGALGRLELEESAVARDVDRQVALLRALVRMLRPWDRRALGATALAFFASFLPWSRQVGFGLEAGVQDWGIATAALAACAAACPLLRERMRALAAPLWAAQMAALLAAVAICVWRGLTIASTPFIGLYLTALAASAAFASTLAGWASANDS